MNFTKSSREKRHLKRTWKSRLPKKNAPKLAGRRGVEMTAQGAIREGNHDAP